MSGSAVGVGWGASKKNGRQKMGKIAVHVRFFAYFCDINSIPHTIDAGIGYLSGADKSNKGRKR